MALELVVPEISLVETTAESRNVISGNDHSGIAMWGSNAVNNIVLGNFIGTDVTGIASLGNTQFGVLTGSSAGSNRIGGSNPETGNTIAFNGLDGVAIVDGTGNEIQSNSIFSNEDLGIDLESDGVSSNDAGDGDTGANNLQNFPEIALAGIDDYGDLLVQYNVDSNPTNSTYPLNVQFFQSDPGGEGQTYLGDDSYTTTDYNQGYRLANLGNAAGFEIILGDSIVATATDANGNTSEFSSIAVVATYYLVQTFTRITEGVVVNDEGNSYVSNWIDYDNDGYLDLFVMNKQGAINFLYHNNEDGTFTKINSGIIVNDGSQALSSSWGDYDNDSYPDLFVSNWWEKDMLYHNNGDGTFTKITTGPIVAEVSGSRGSAWGDYNNDGFLDLFVANGQTQGHNNFLFKNNGDGTFTKITSGSIVNDGGNSFSCCWSDYNNDGLLDLFVANGGFDAEEDNFLYKNNGDGTFTKITSGVIVTDGGKSFGGSWGDYDNDSYMDLFVASDDPDKNRLYKNDGDGTFTKVMSGSIVNEGNTFYCNWVDYDNDGDLDVYTINDWRNGPLFQNNGDGTFTKITAGNFLNDDWANQGFSWGDFDKDGDTDLFLAHSNDYNNSLFTNDGNNNSWINIKCTGTTSNASAIGTKVRVRANINGSDVWQLQEISGQSTGGQGAQNSFNAEIGLGNATIIDSIKIEWPSGIVDRFANVSVNQFVGAREENTLPDGENDAITTPEDTPVTFNVSTLLGNDTDADGDIITYQSVDFTSALGAMVTEANNMITYTPLPDFNGNDTFNYTISDGNLGGTATGTVIVTVTPVNDAPAAVNDNLSTTEDSPKTFSVNSLLSNDTDIDVDVLSVLSVDTTNTEGSAAIDPGDTTITFTPKPDFFGTDIFNYTISDGSGGMDTASVNVTVSPVDDKPVAVNDNIAIDEDSTVTISVLSNDVDVDGDQLLIQSIDTTGTVGEVTINQGNVTLTYTPIPNYFGTDSLLYIITDGHVGGTDTAAVVVTVSLINDLPLAANDSLSTPEDSSLTILVRDILANDTDVETDTLLLQSIITTGTSGFVMIDAGDTSITYTPADDFNGDDSFSYTISDEDGGTDTATVKITVTPVQDAPLPFELISPIEAAEVGSTLVTFNWHASIDPDLDEVIYNFYLSGADRDTAVYDIPDTVLVFDGNTFIKESTVYTWGVKVTDGTDTTSCVADGQFETADVIVGIDDQDQIPDVYALSQNYPNPFNPSTIIEYDLPEESFVNLTIYNLLGEQVAILVNDRMNAGRYEVKFIANNVPSGVYFYQIQSGNFMDTKKMLLVR